MASDYYNETYYKFGINKTLPALFPFSKYSCASLPSESLNLSL